MSFCQSCADLTKELEELKRRMAAMREVVESVKRDKPYYADMPDTCTALAALAKLEEANK